MSSFTVLQCYFGGGVSKNIFFTGGELSLHQRAPLIASQNLKISHMFDSSITLVPTGGILASRDNAEVNRVAERRALSISCQHPGAEKQC